MTNPYAPPRAQVAAALAGLSPSTPVAGRGARFLNMMLDSLFASLLAFGVGFLLGKAGAGPWLAWSKLGAWLFEVLLYNAYYLGLEASFGWTVAKLITGTRVVDEHGGRPAFMNLLGRTLARNVPFEPFSFLGKTGVGWHDRWSGTRVVSLRRTSGATLEDSFKADFGTAIPDQAATQAFIPTDGPPAWCPNCALLITATTPKCRCGADFTSPEGWKPLASLP